MNEGVLMILDRMKTNPEEFSGIYNRWATILEEYDNVLSDDEAKAIKEELHKLRRAELTSAVMQELLREPTPVEVTPSTYTMNRIGRAPWSANTTDEQLEQLRIHMQKEAEKIRAQNPFKPFIGEIK